jgi:DNA-binding CsgD family transcriptional regulator
VTGFSEDTMTPLYLTPRERDIAIWLVKGKTDFAIGAILGISPKTVNYHIERAKRRANVASRITLAVLIYAHGYADPTADDADNGQILPRVSP